MLIFSGTSPLHNYFLPNLFIKIGNGNQGLLRMFTVLYLVENMYTRDYMIKGDLRLIIRNLGKD